MKFKVGDKVKFIGKVANHRVHGENLQADIEKYNNRFTISRISTTGYVEFKENECWCIEFDEIELILEKQFTKSDLQNGDIVTYRDGRKKIVFEDKFYGSNHFVLLKYYTEDLKDIDGEEENDIIKVERPVKYETVFERKEEILDETEKRYLASVIKPFKNKIETIEKTIKIGDSSLCYLIMLLKNNDMANLPNFKKNSMYKGMETNKKYTLKELGL
jgi:hypothetical protein